MKIVIVLMFFSGCMYGMDERRNEPTSAVVDISMISELVSAQAGARAAVYNDDSDSDSEDLCKTAISSYYPPQYRHQSFYILPALKRLVREKKSSPAKCNSDALGHLRRMRSGDLSDTDSSDKSNSEVQSLLLEAAHHAIEERERELFRKVQSLRENEERLEKKMSKKQAALISTILTIVGTVAGTISAHYSK